jgi:hypothetical protein
MSHPFAELLDNIAKKAMLSIFILISDDSLRKYFVMIDDATHSHDE